MRYHIRLRVFLLCCLLMIGMNVMLIIGGFVPARSMADDAGSLTGCDAIFMAWGNAADSYVNR